MVSKSKTQFLKNDIILIQLRPYQWKTNQIIKQYHQQFSITILVPLPASDKVYLERPCAGLQAIYRRYNNSLLHKSRDFLVKLSLQTSHRRCGIMHLLALKTLCSAYVSQDVSKNGYLAQIKFSRKMCQIGKTRFQNYFYKNLDLFIKDPK